MATVTLGAPSSRIISAMTWGRRNAALLVETLVAPAAMTAPAEATSLMPPPTVKGMVVDGGHALDNLEQRRAVFDGGGDVEHGQFIGARRAVGLGRTPPGPGILDVHEVHALDNASLLHVQTGHDAEA